MTRHVVPDRDRAQRRAAPRPPGHPAMTVVELLVIMAIVAVVAALLLPAVQLAREASRKTQCQGNLKQLGVAVQSYHDAFGCLPINMGPWHPWFQPGPALNGKGWIVGVLPHVEQQELYDQFAFFFYGDFSAGGGLKNPACVPGLQTRLNVLLCPSDSSSRSLSVNQYQWVGTPVAQTNYKGVLGDNRLGGSQSMHPGSLDCLASGGCNGLFFRLTFREPQQVAGILDGTSQTFLLGEDVAAQNHHSVAFYSNGDYAACHAPLNFFPKPPRPDDWWDVMSFRSLHPGGAHFCLADGSVRFLSESIAYPLYRALSTKNGSEAVTLP